MKFPGTLKLEISKPSGADWNDVGPRLRILRKTVSRALAMTMQDFHAEAFAEIRAKWEGEKSTDSWRSQVAKRLLANWKTMLQRELEYRGKDVEANRLICMPVTDPLTCETADNILNRFAGQHLSDLVGLKASFPSFTRPCSFYIKGGYSVFSGDPDDARVTLPIYGSGKRSTEFILKIGGGSARAQWRKIVSDFGRRDDVIQVEKQLKEIGRWQESERSTLEKLKAKKKASTSLEEKRAIGLEIETFVKTVRGRQSKESAPLEASVNGVTKVGRVGVNYNENRKKWFVSISFVQYRPDNYKVGKKASLHFGVNVFAQALTEDGVFWEERGSQILAKRLAFRSSRRRIQESMRLFGNGSRGHGKKRRELPMTKRAGWETNYVDTFIRQFASEYIRWCRGQGISDVLVEDMTGAREKFEERTKGEAHPEIKRRIHSWPFYKTVQAVELEGLQCNYGEAVVRVHHISLFVPIARCPRCGHTSTDNLFETGRSGEAIYVNEELYRQVDKWHHLLCKSCGYKRALDVIRCGLMLEENGVSEIWQRLDGRAKKDTKKLIYGAQEQLNREHFGERPLQ